MQRLDTCKTGRDSFRHIPLKKNFNTDMKLSLQHLSKTYPNGVKALDNIDLTISSGMFGLLGPNGAGKSSLMRTIATLQLPDEGEVLFNEMDIFTNRIAFRKQLGYLPQTFGVYPRTSAWSLLDYFATLKGISTKRERHQAVDRVLELTNLQTVKHKKVSTFSGGMKQRFGIAQLLLNQPKVIIVDEPTAGLDPAERTRFLNVLRAIGNENIVLFSTHLVEDVKELCQDMAIINKGKLLTQIAPKAAIEQLNGKIWETPLEETVLQKHAVPCTLLSSSYNDDHQLIHRIYAQQRLSAACSIVSPRLEDFYFATLNQQ